MRDTILKQIKTTESGLIDQRVDTIQLSNFTIPSAGLPSDKGCVWNGNFVYAYQTESWFIEVTAKCNGKDYPLKGNMPFTETPNVGNQHQYDLMLTLPSADVGTDDALFAKPEGDADLFAAADGITGQIIMKESGYVKSRLMARWTSSPRDRCHRHAQRPEHSARGGALARHDDRNPVAGVFRGVISVRSSVR